MRNKILLGVVGILTIVLIVIVRNVKQTYFEPLPIKEGETPVTIRLLDTSTNIISEINLEDYIIGVVAAEMPASFNLEALKAQAVAARTYAMYKKETRNLDYDLIIGTSDQAYQNNKQLLDKWGISFFNYYFTPIPLSLLITQQNNFYIIFLFIYIIGRSSTEPK